MPPFTPSHILIFGATGAIGRFITNSVIRSKPNFPKITIFTSPSTNATKEDLIGSWKSAGASIIVGDITNASDVANAYHDVDTVISCVGRAVLDQQKELIRLAEESSNVQWFLPSEYGTDIEHNERSATEKPHQMKLGVRRYIREHTNRLKATYVVVGPYFDMWLDQQDQVGGYDLEAKSAFLIEDGEGKIGFTTMEDTGKAVVAALRHPDVSFNKALKIASFVVTPNQVLADLEKQLGAKFTTKYIPLADLEKSEADMWKAGNPAATIATLRRIWATGGTLYNKWDNESIGLKETDMDSLETAVRGCIKAKGL